MEWNNILFQNDEDERASITGYNAQLVDAMATIIFFFFQINLNCVLSTISFSEQNNKINIDN